MTRKKIFIYSAAVAISAAACYFGYKFYKKHHVAEDIEDAAEPNIAEKVVEEPAQNTVETSTANDSTYDILLNHYGLNSDGCDDDEKEEDEPQEAYEVGLNYEIDDYIHRVDPRECANSLDYDEYNVIGYSYYDGNKILTNEYGEELDAEDIEEYIEPDFAEHFGEYESDSVWYRNDRYKCYFEILRKYGDYPTEV